MERSNRLGKKDEKGRQMRENKIGNKLGRILEIGKINEKVPQQRENKIGPNLRTSPQSKAIA